MSVVRLLGMLLALVPAGCNALLGLDERPLRAEGGVDATLGDAKEAGGTNDSGAPILVGIDHLPQNPFVDSVQAGTCFAYLYRAGKSGVVQELGVYLATGTNVDAIVLALYSGSESMPQDLLTTVTVSQPDNGWTPGWYVQSVSPARVSVVAGATYWLALLGPQEADAEQQIKFVDVGDLGQPSQSAPGTALRTAPPSGTAWDGPASYSPLAAYAAGAVPP